MKSLKHTPTPWKAVFSEEETEYWISAKIGSFGLNIANINGGKMGDTISTDEAKSNANLIAAAPELLEALIEAKKVITAFNFRHTLIEDIDKIITKATE